MAELVENGELGVTYAEAKAMLKDGALGSLIRETPSGCFKVNEHALHALIEFALVVGPRPARRAPLSPDPPTERGRTRVRPLRDDP